MAEACGEIVRAGFNVVYPCALLRPCPVHGTKASVAATGNSLKSAGNFGADPSPTREKEASDA